MAVQPLDRLIHGPLQCLRDARAVQLDVENLAFEARAAAGLARDEDVGEEHHLDQHVAGAFAGFAPASRNIEGNVLGS